MKILMIDAPYDEFLRNIYRTNCKLQDTRYEVQLCTIMKYCFGAADFYTHALRELGHEATDVLWNGIQMQKRWARDQAPSLHDTFPQNAPWPELRTWLWQVLEARVEAEKPDVLYLQTIYDLPADLLHRMKRHARLLVGQRAAPIPTDYDHSALDLVISSLPNMVAQFKTMGLDAEFQPLGFDARVLECLPPQKKLWDVVFVGGLGSTHAKRTEFLEAIAQRTPIHIWGYGVDSIRDDSPLLHNYHGQAWGEDLYRHFNAARIVLNVHSSWAEGYANNLRMFEATGVGTCLLTDHMTNINDYFQPGKEVFTYADEKECIRMIHHILKHETEREAVAHAGQKQTLSTYTYEAIAKQMESMLSARLA